LLQILQESFQQKGECFVGIEEKATEFSYQNRSAKINQMSLAWFSSAFEKWGWEAGQLFVGASSVGIEGESPGSLFGLVETGLAIFKNSKINIIVIYMEYTLPKPAKQVRISRCLMEPFYGSLGGQKISSTTNSSPYACWESRNQARKSEKSFLRDVIVARNDESMSLFRSLSRSSATAPHAWNQADAP
jgi:hypothetical protein